VLADASARIEELKSLIQAQSRGHSIDQQAHLKVFYFPLPWAPDLMHRCTLSAYLKRGLQRSLKGAYTGQAPICALLCLENLCAAVPYKVPMKYRGA
jgi:hypothetical protein